jgi:hypothetical protein
VATTGKKPLDTGVARPHTGRTPSNEESIMRVTFTTEDRVREVAFFMPENVRIGAQWVVDLPRPSGEMVNAYAILWDHENEDAVMDLFPVGAISVPFEKALPTLVDKFGLHIPCVSAT